MIKRYQYMPYNMGFALTVVDRIGKSIDPLFQMTSDVKPVYEQLIQYFHGDPAFPGDLTKGVLLMGPTGTGKTLAMRIMARYREIDNTKFVMNNQVYRMNYEVVDVSHVVNSFISKAFDGINQYIKRYIICLDDIGSESSMAKHFGNKIDVVSYIITERYTSKLLTLGTTNYPLKTLEEKYDDRVVSRMYGMFNFITMKGADFRRINSK